MWETLKAMSAETDSAIAAAQQPVALQESGAQASSASATAATPDAAANVSGGGETITGGSADVSAADTGAPKRSSASASSGEAASQPPKAKRARKAAAEYESLSVDYGVDEPSYLNSVFAEAPVELYEQVSEQVRRLVADSGASLEQVLQLPANVTNKRLFDKVVQLRDRQAKLLEESAAALKMLLENAVIAAAAKHTKELKNRQALERKQKSGAATEKNA